MRDKDEIELASLVLPKEERECCGNCVHRMSMLEMGKIETTSLPSKEWGEPLGMNDERGEWSVVPMAWFPREEVKVEPTMLPLLFGEFGDPPRLIVSNKGCEKGEVCMEIEGSKVPVIPKEKENKCVVDVRDGHAYYRCDAMNQMDCPNFLLGKEKQKCFHRGTINDPACRSVKARRDAEILLILDAVKRLQEI